MPKPLRALTLVSCENDKLILHEDVLHHVFESREAMNRPVAVISIAGMFRKGKSFFLNFVLRYLKSQCSGNWIRSERNVMDGFEWKADMQGVTSGITIWPEVFVVKEVAIVLMDTQGLFDESKSTIEGTYIMVLSTLFSSVQILNHQENLNSADLKNFEFFAQYGLALSNKAHQVKGFQNLMFLIRDWKHESVHPYGLEGGNDYLEDLLQSEINEELQTINDMLDNFRKHDCFLMPYPGEQVARDEEFRGDISKIEQNFLEHMEKLVEHLIQNVDPKFVLGKKANGETLMPVMKMYVKCLNDGKLPVPKSPIELQMSLLLNEAQTKCCKIYDDKMHAGTRETLLKKSEMENLHKVCADEAIAVFDELPDFGNKKQIEAMKLEILQTIETTRYSDYKKAMDEMVKSNLQKCYQQSKINYSRRVNQATGLKKLKQFKAQAQQCRETTIVEFTSTTKFGDTDKINPLLHQLREFMNDEYERAKAAYKHEHSLKTKVKKFFRRS